MRFAVSAALLALFVAAPAVSDDESRWQDLREELFGDRVIHEGSGIVTLDAPDRAYDAAIVPIRFESVFAQTHRQYIKTVTLLVDENPLPVAGRFHFTPASGKAAISTRIRINAYTHVRAIAETSDGELHMAARYVKASGGCSAPAGKDAEAALARIGKMRFRHLGAVIWGQPNQAQILVSHPNHTGMQMDQVTHHYVPPHFVDSIEVKYVDQPILTVEANFSLSENPSIHFYYVPEEPGELSVQVTDSEGQVFARAWPVPTAVAEAPQVDGGGAPGQNAAH